MIAADAAIAQSAREARPESVASALLSGRLGAFAAKSALAACLIPLLNALGWRGNLRHVAEALPHFADSLDLVGLRNALAVLNFDSQPWRGNLAQLDARLLPCLFVPRQGAAMVVLARDGLGVEVYDGGRGARRHLDNPDLPGTAYLFRPRTTDGPAEAAGKGFVRVLVGRFRPLIQQIMAATLGLNLLALATPLFIMAIYDWVIARESAATLVGLAAGVAIALAADLALRALRVRLIAYVGARLDFIVGSTVLRRILYMPPSLTESAQVGGQIARIKEFEALREFFTGPVVTVLVEVPFLALFMVVIGVLGGPLAAVPAAAIALYVLLGLFLVPRVRVASAAASAAAAGRQGFLVETLDKIRVLKHAGAEERWLVRHRELAATATRASMRTALISSMAQSASHVLIGGTGLALMAFGALRVLDGAMSVGALIAIMMLAWRALSPLQSALVVLSRLEQMRTALRQLDQLMRLPLERDPAAASASRKRFSGRIVFNRVSMRYRSDGEPALLGVSVEVAPREVVAITGTNGSGKSTVLKLIAGLYVPQAGTLSIDGLDLRQLNPIVLRQSVAYVPQVCQLFHGTIAQNLRLSDPTASDEDLRRAAADAHVRHEIERLPNGFDTRIGDQQLEQLPSSFRQRLCLARAYVRRTPIFLFDEATNNLDAEGDAAFMRMLAQLRESSTIVMVTHRPSHMHLADRVLMLDGGLVVAQGAPEAVLKRL